MRYVVISLSPRGRAATSCNSLESAMFVAACSAMHGDAYISIVYPDGELFVVGNPIRKAVAA